MLARMPMEPGSLRAKSSNSKPRASIAAVGMLADAHRMHTIRSAAGYNNQLPDDNPDMLTRASTTRSQIWSHEEALKGRPIDMRFFLANEDWIINDDKNDVNTTKSMKSPGMVEALNEIEEFTISEREESEEYEIVLSPDATSGGVPGGEIATEGTQKDGDIQCDVSMTLNEVGVSMTLDNLDFAADLAREIEMQERRGTIDFDHLDNGHGHGQRPSYKQ